MEQSLLLYLAHSQSTDGWALYRLYTVLGTGGEGALSDTCRNRAGWGEGRE